MKLAIASDHAGHCLKEEIKKEFVDFEWVDFGSYDEDSTDYPDTGHPAAQAIANGDCDMGVLICGSGIGMSIVANRVKGIRAALCVDVEFAKLARLHNNANVLVLPGRFVSIKEAFYIVHSFFETEFEGGRHQQRIEKIDGEN